MLLPILPCLYWYIQGFTERFAFFHQLMKLTGSSFVAFSISSQPLTQPHPSYSRRLVPTVPAMTVLCLCIIDRIYCLEILC